ncbi:VOC family protein [Streptomyces sp. NPDC088785]|uniref:VOC family protein n=1 Tax=Streptomyces sp. NPDC088785 TaxID=3365897 RepID=UPI00381F569A
MNIVASALLLTVADPAASSRFFTTHLGFREVLLTAEAVHLARDDAAADVVVLQAPTGDGQPVRAGTRASSDVAICLTVTGLAAEHERLRRERAHITLPLRQEAWGEWAVQLTDPNGVVIRLVEWVPPAGA